MHATIWDTVTMDDLPTDDLRWIARAISLDAAKAIWRKFAGNRIACPARMPRTNVQNYMRDNFDKSIHELAVGAGVSERTICRYMDVPAPRRDDRQTSLF